MTTKTRDRVQKISLTDALTVQKFVMDPSRVRIITGAVGSGKSVGCCGEVMRLAMDQEPSPDGIRYSKVGIIRNTYAELRTTTLATWKDMFPEDICGPVIHSAPIEHHIKIEDEDGVGLDLKVLFVSADRPKDVRKLLSLELSFIWFNEVREIERSIFTAAGDRIGRYPSLKTHGVWPTRDCIIADTNAADEDSWLYEMEMEAPKDHAFFHQPPAVYEISEIPEDLDYDEEDLIPAAGTKYLANPNAENKKNLKPNYYESKIPGKTRDWISVYYQGHWGYIADGKPVVPGYNDSLMCRDDLPIIEDKELLIGIDIGGGTLSPAAIIGQRSPRGVWMIHAEIVCSEMGLENFSKEINFCLNDIFEGRKIDRGWADPAGKNRDPLYETTIIQHLQSKGLPVREGPTNQIKPRVEAIMAPMGRFVDSQPGFLIHKRCKVLRAGLAGKWKYKRVQTVGPAKYSNVPDKNDWSHPCDALGYLLSGGGENTMLKGRNPDRHTAKTRKAFKPFSPFAR
jgi:hypothetical protein